MDIYIPSGRRDSFERNLCALLAVPRKACELVERFGGHNLEYLRHEMRQVSVLRTRSHMFVIMEDFSDVPGRTISMAVTTTAMNILAHDHIAIAYPRLTLQWKGMVNHGRHRSFSQQAKNIQKAMDRGYKLTYAIQGPLPNTRENGNPCTKSYSCPEVVRSFYDEKSLVIPFVGNHVTELERAAQWSLGGFGCGSGCTQFSLSLIREYSPVVGQRVVFGLE